MTMQNCSTVGLSHLKHLLWGFPTYGKTKNFGQTKGEILI